MKKILILAAVLAGASTAAFADDVSTVVSVVASCCDGIAECCKQAMACCN